MVKTVSKSQLCSELLPPASSVQWLVFTYILASSLLL